MTYTITTKDCVLTRTNKRAAIKLARALCAKGWIGGTVRVERTSTTPVAAFRREESRGGRVVRLEVAL